MQEWITAVIGVGGTLSGTGLGYRGALAISRRDDAAMMRERMRTAYAEYLGTLYVSVGELRDLPPNKPPNWLDQKITRLQGEHGAWIARRRAEFKLSGDRYRDIAARLVTAAAYLQVLPVPPEIRDAVKDATDYAERLGENRTPELEAAWPEIHSRLLAAAKALDG